MPSGFKFNLTVDDLSKKLINFATDTLKVMLTNTLPASTAHLYSDISATEVANGNGYTTGGQTVPGTGATNSGGLETIAGSVISWTAAGGNIGPFRYAILYDLNSGTLLGGWDNGASITLQGAFADVFSFSPSGSVLATIQ